MSKLDSYNAAKSKHDRVSQAAASMEQSPGFPILLLDMALYVRSDGSVSVQEGDTMTELANDPGFAVALARVLGTVQASLSDKADQAAKDASEEAQAIVTRGNSAP